MRKSVPKMGRLLVPPALSCLPPQPPLAHSRAATEMPGPVPVVGDRTTIDVALAPVSKLLGVVVGYLAQDRQNVSAAVGSLNVKEAVGQPVPTMITRCRRWRAASRWS